jgi:hypothetical protein
MLLGDVDKKSMFNLCKIMAEGTVCMRIRIL